MKTSELIDHLDQVRNPLFDERDIPREIPTWMRDVEPERIEIDRKPLITLDPESWRHRRYPQIEKGTVKQGTETLAWYRPYHLKPNKRWGIYIREQGLLYLTDLFYHESSAKPDVYDSFMLAFSVLHNHESFHFLTEVAATFCEMTDGNPRYKYYVRNRRKDNAISEAIFLARILAPKYKQYSQLPNLRNPLQFEEAPANAHVLASGIPRRAHEAVARFMTEKQPVGYKDFHHFANPEVRAYGKRFLGLLLRSGRNRKIMHFFSNTRVMNTPFEITFSVDPEECIKEIPVYLVRDFRSRIGSTRLEIPPRKGIHIWLHPGDHPPPHIHAKIGYSGMGGRYHYPSLKPMKGTDTLSRKDEKRLRSVIQWDDNDSKIRDELSKVG